MESGDFEFESRLSQHLWEVKYRRGEKEQTIHKTWERVAHVLASIENSEIESWTEDFYQALLNFKFLPSSQILAHAGTDSEVTLISYFGMKVVEDSIEGVFDSLRHTAGTLQKGGSVSVDFSTLRPRQATALSSDQTAAGPVAFLGIWNQTCETLLGHSRNCAVMVSLRCDHPDVLLFLESTMSQSMRLKLALLITDEFMQAVQKGAPWNLVFPVGENRSEREVIVQDWNGQKDVECEIYATIQAHDIWTRLAELAQERTAPALVFVDRVNRENNLYYREYLTTISADHGMPLPPRGSCPSGSLNLTAFIHHPFSEQASFDIGELLKTTALAVRMLDNTIDLTNYPYPELATYEQSTRRIGLGITGLADCLIMLGLSYGEKRAVVFAEDMMKAICHQAYQTSAALAQEKGMFPWCQPSLYLESDFVRRAVPEVVCDEIARHGIRNSHLLMIAPNSDVSTLANNLTPGIEPVFDVSYRKTLENPDGSTEDFVFTDYAFQLWKKQFRRQSVPHQFVDAQTLDPFIHLEMQSTLQRYVDHSVGKDIRFPKGMAVSDIERIYLKAYEQGVKVVGL